uniref:Casein kinase II subunit beta n=1 Tax=Entomoneis paludosa TaxID=265537 RepID=A0A7S2YFK9_9STRA|mmetsp:Transcript_31118/g.64926  ORF Transcript_31118/g.64926 Transcript_31118/m.64926 type:complete len:318 (+) Transcript_31118:158-1111(+)|eukprot:CAMPEP_0172440264 /NCGR_PEP_ID=MMETSP1065-20121228/949_1 /TAXON_ID=265537 /ORGANISM="Amphiprora paludosa, Strain CCMP125" /LENGTH=317 /DNA_ID=CAMNT_0013189051 /DNA_START=137 /DNA_END=1090 /DNA_ORIENTATION=-
MAFNEDSSASGHDEPWIQWFCGLKGHEMFCEVERSYIEDGFNLYGLRACVSNFSDCLDLILDRIGPDDSDDSHLTQSACTLYGLIHARYIITAHGLDAMYNKYAAKDFGTCPLVQCQLQNVLPVGVKDEMGADTVKLFCPKCQQVYHAPPVRSRANNNGGVDGAAFGTTFPHLFLMTFSNLVPDPLPMTTSYIPRVFGFRVHKSARQQHRATTPAIAPEPSNSQSMAAPSGANQLENNNNNGAVNDGVDADASRNKGTSGGSKPPRGRSNAKEEASGGAPSELPNGGANKRSADGSAPTFLMENTSTKRRRRGGGST